MRRKRSDAQRNRAALITAARTELQRHGSLSMQRIAGAADVSRSTLYRHFPTAADLERSLVEEALEDARRAIEGIALEDRPPLARLRRVVDTLAELGAERRLDLLQGLRLGPEAEQAADAVLPILRALLDAAEVGSPPPGAWLRRAAVHLLHACLAVGATDPGDPKRAAQKLFQELTEPLDRGLIVLDPQGSVMCVNRRAARMLDPTGSVEVGERLTAPRVPVLYEDGSPCEPGSYPLAAALRTGQGQTAVRGHGDRGGALRWISVDARPLRHPHDGAVYGLLGILTDVSPETEWERGRLRPAGQLEPVRPVPLDLVRILDEIPPHLFPEQFVSEARRVSGGPVAMYVLDIDGTHLLRLAGAEEFPARLPAPLALGPELAQDGIAELTSTLQSELPGVAIAPMWLRGRGIGLLLALGAAEEPLVELGRLGAAAMELAGGFTDVIDAARRRKETRAAAELQQSLLPPRIARLGGGEVAGTVLPSYEVGGDWFDYVENRDGAWIAIADAAGKGATAGALGGIALAALRAARRSDQSLEDAARTMHEVVCDVGRPEFFVTSIVARWHAVYSVFSWINCGHPPPLVVRADDTIEQLTTEPGLPLGLWDRERRFTRHQRRLEGAERLILHSDGITARRTSSGLFGLDGIERAVREAPGRSASAIAKAIQEAVMSAAEDPLQDDAVAIVLAPAPELAPARQGSSGTA